MASTFPFERKAILIKGIKKTIARKISNKAAQHFKNNFKKGGFVDTNLSRWRRSERAIRTGDKTLIDTGRLRRSIKPVRVSFTKSIIKTVNVPYARRHNDGLEMVKRQFMGRSKKLESEMKKVIVKELLFIFKP